VVCLRVLALFAVCRVVKGARQGITVMITFRKSYNSPVPQQMLRMVPSRPNPLSKFAGRLLSGLDFVPANCSDLGQCCFLVLQDCEDLFNTLYLLTSLQTKVTVHFVDWKLVLLQAGTRMFCDIFQQTHI
jgi:hypothetical protein